MILARYQVCDLVVLLVGEYLLFIFTEDRPLAYRGRLGRDIVTLLLLVWYCWIILQLDVCIFV